ncbi:hypothetical protein RRG08_028734 [Elysia crispata]|uniref:Uncharacterized protein n=1 Tax=Elysia crispata TaxID=231223 RepID=A0AAE1DIH6_9GAST|nr:hypothetical protein RRG08_028734 [Elysia crispata]
MNRIPTIAVTKTTHISSLSFLFYDDRVYSTAEANCETCKSAIIVTVSSSYSGRLRGDAKEIEAYQMMKDADLRR